MDNQINSYVWEEVSDFSDYREFERFLQWIAGQVESKEAKELPVASHYANAPAFQEKWFKQHDSDQIWRLVWPDAPFGGVFERVLS